MKAFITKYALTIGIQEVNGQVLESSPTMLSVDGPTPGSLKKYFHRGEWYLKREDAVERAKQMKLKRITSLKKSLAATEKLEFT